MKLNQDLMIIVLKTLETIELTTTVDIKFLMSSLNYLFLITDCQSWKALNKNMSKNRSDLNERWNLYRFSSR